jgi:transmembrane sensor
MSEMNKNGNEALLIAYMNNELNAAGKLEVETWLNASAENKNYFNELKEVWILTGKVNVKPVDVNTNLAWDKINSRIQKSTQPKKNNVISIRKWYAAAAVAIILVGAFALIKFLSGGNEMMTLSAKNDVVIDTLQDGSVISLNKGAELEYPDEFDNDERRVVLHGEAFFEIVPDTEKPFIIALDNQAEVKVLGTSFNIQETDSTTTVFVKTGKVEFKSGQNSVILLPGEKGILNLSTNEIKKASPKEIKFNETYWLDQKLNFDDQTLGEIISILESVFETNIELENKDASNCRLTTNFERETLEHILEVISASFEMELIKTKNGFILKGNGC